MTDTRKISKRYQLKETLAGRIVSGEFTYGRRFPGLHQLCREYSTSYVTVSRAMKLLEKEGYLQAHNGVGYFVSYISPDIVSTQKKVNFITTLPSNSPFNGIIDTGRQLFADSGWEVKLHFNRELSECSQQLNSPDTWNVVFFSKISWENYTANLRHFGKKVVVLGQLSGNQDITSIISDEYETIRRCIEYLRSKNRTRTAIVAYAQNKELDMLRIAAWRSIMRGYGFSLSQLDLLCFDPGLSIERSTTTKKSEKLSNWLRINKKHMDSIIFPSQQEPLLEACRENALRIPEDLAVINIAPLPGSQNAVFPILDNNLQGHFQCALDILEERFKTGRKSPGSWHFIPPGELL